MAEDGLTNLVVQIRKYTELARRVLRRWWIIAIFASLGIGGSLAMAFTATRIYQSRALVAWKMNINWQDLGRQNNERPHEDMLRHQVSQLTASNTLLLKIANELDLYPGERGVVAPEVILEYMRDAITFNTVGDDTFWIAFEYKDRKLAQKATARLVKEFIAQNVQDKLSSAKGTQVFMEGEAAKVKQQLEDIEGRLAKFISDNPEFQVYLTGIPVRNNRRDRNTGASNNTGASVRYVEIKDSPELKEALAEKGRLEAELVALAPQGKQRLRQVQTELNRAQSNLASLRQKYTDQHPDVQRATLYLRAVQRRYNAASRSNQERAGQANTIRARIEELDTAIAQLSAKRRKVVTRKKKPQAAQETPAKPDEEALSAQAQLEKLWYSLSGERAVARAKYEEIQSQLQRSRLSAAAIRKQAEKEFQVVDPASYPGKPIRPSRKKIVLAGSALGLLLGLGLATMLVLFDPRIYNEDDLKKACDLPLLAQIPRDGGKAG